MEEDQEEIGIEMKEEKLTLSKILIGEVKSQANLKSSFQQAKVLIVPAQENYSAKIGLEVKLIPISSEMKIDEEKFKPKSIFFIVDEIPKLDVLIQALVKGRWIFFLHNRSINTDDTGDMVEFYCRKIKESIMEGINEWKQKKL
jgi:hypothetical protein